MLQRFSEGVSLVGLLREHLGPGSLRILDVGTGNAGVATAIANVESIRVTALDHAFNPDVVSLITLTTVPLDYVVGSGTSLPWANGSFDAVLCLETIEHVPQATNLGTEIMRVLKPGGICVLTTPARFRFSFRRDPHFGVPGLLLLPDALQRLVVSRVLRVVPYDEYDVHHIYWFARNVARLFPGREFFQAIGRPPHHPLLRKAWSLLQRVAWDRCIVRKSG